MEIFELAEVLKTARKYETKHHHGPNHYCIAQQVIDLQSKILGFQDLEGKPLINTDAILVNFTREVEVRFDFGKESNV